MVCEIGASQCGIRDAGSSGDVDALCSLCAVPRMRPRRACYIVGLNPLLAPLVFPWLFDRWPMDCVQLAEQP